MELYWNIEELIEIYKNNSASTVFEALKENADNGNMASAHHLFFFCLHGGWDMRALENDSLLKKVVEPAENVDEDHYLIFKQDKELAKEYCRKIIQYFNKKSLIITLEALAFRLLYSGLECPTSYYDTSKAYPYRDPNFSNIRSINFFAILFSALIHN